MLLSQGLFLVVFKSGFVMVGLKIIQLNDLRFDTSSELNPFTEIKPKVLDRSKRQKSLGLQIEEESGFIFFLKMSETSRALWCRFVMIDA